MICEAIFTLTGIGAFSRRVVADVRKADCRTVVYCVAPSFPRNAGVNAERSRALVPVHPGLRISPLRCGSSSSYAGGPPIGDVTGAGGVNKTRLDVQRRPRWLASSPTGYARQEMAQDAKQLSGVPPRRARTGWCVGRRDPTHAGNCGWAGRRVGLLPRLVGPRSALSGVRRHSNTIAIGHHRSITWLTEPVTVNRREQFPQKKAAGWR